MLVESRPECQLLIESKRLRGTYESVEILSCSLYGRYARTCASVLGGLSGLGRDNPLRHPTNDSFHSAVRRHGCPMVCSALRELGQYLVSILSHSPAGLWVDFDYHADACHRCK